MTSTTAAADGSFSATVPVSFGSNAITVTATAAGGKSTGYAQVTVTNEGGGSTVLDVTDPSGDDNGPGTYQYPTASDFHAGAFDLTRFQVLSDGTFAYLRATLRNLDPTFGQTDGAQLLDVYVHVPGAASTSTQAAFASRNYTIAPAGAWSQRVEVQGFASPVWVNASGGSVGTASVLAEQADRTITIALPEAQFGTPASGWGFSVVLTGQDGFSSDQARAFTATAQPFTFGVCAPGGTAPVCAADPGTVPKAVDVITPAGCHPGHRARPHPRPRGHPAGAGALARAVRGGGPGEVRRVDAGADRVPPGVGQPDPGDELVTRPQGLLDQTGIDVDQAELGPAEHAQRPVALQVTPDQPEVAVIADAAHERPGEVEAVLVPPDRDRHLPAGRGRVPWHRLDGHPGLVRHGQRGPVLAVAAQRDVDVLIAPSVRLRPAGAAG